MSVFWYNNFHFALEFYGAIALIVAAWLAVDAFVLTKRKSALLKALGFGFFAVWQVIHALDVKNEFWLLFGMTSLVVGLFLVLLDLYVEMTPGRPKSFELIFVLPALARLWPTYAFVGGILAGLTALLAFYRYRSELNQPLKWFWVSMGLISISLFTSTVASSHLETGNAWWLAEHAIRIAGFLFLSAWVQQYLWQRLREQMLLIFVTMALMISLVVTFTFSALLLGQMRRITLQNLTANARIFSSYIERLRDEAKTRSLLAAKDPGLIAAASSGNFAAMEDRIRAMRQESGADLLTLTDPTGAVMQRATYRTARADTLAGEPAVVGALQGKPTADFSSLPPEGLSVRGASPIYSTSTKALIGTVETGFLLDGIFLDNFKRSTDIDMSLFAGDTLHASTILDIDGQTRPLGLKLAGFSSLNEGLAGGKAKAGSMVFFGRSHLTSQIGIYSGNSLIGVISASYPELAIAETAVATNRLTLLVTLAIVMALLVPGYLVMKKVAEAV